MKSLNAGEYDAVYCSHNLEHYYRHDVPKVLGGFADIRVPDLQALMKIVVEKNIDIDDFLYQSPARPITVRDVIYAEVLEENPAGVRGSICIHGYRESRSSGHSSEGEALERGKENVRACRRLKHCEM